ncbi:fibronectin type 3 and ankyrin repeat domains protein 1 [Zeugodacus cucurbitae]|uniref:fibronectin type 3 and ankyrin repeat domains protein 1 n=1 Tax=Zeugodacus cucurbitae TaxID=28588 RepID=UPI0023D914E1|nr:fibronectin type 3 and ankyrin repeat domains protein 1 [Zeugodacus cucurbitae]
MQKQESELKNDDISGKTEKIAIEEYDKLCADASNGRSENDKETKRIEANIRKMENDGDKQEYNSDISADNGGEEHASEDNLLGEEKKLGSSSNIEEKVEDTAIPCDSSFNVRVVEEKINCIRLDWNLLDDVDVYKIEKYHRRHGWEQVAWVGNAPTIIENLDENFTYRMRIKGQCFSEARGLFEDCKVSPEFLVTTLAPLPTTLCLHRAIKKGQQFLVKRILRRRSSLLDYPGPNGYLPLANAIMGGQHCVTDVLLSHGASVHTGNPLNGRTPLQLAFYHGRLAVARILLNRKAQLEATDINGMTACHFAVDANQLELLRFALENGANVNATDACGWSLLSRAVVMGADVGVLKLLLAYGADAKSTDKLGKTCVDLAYIYKNDVARDYLAKALRPKQ